MAPKISIYTFLSTTALVCNLSEIFLQTPALECISGNTWSSDIFASTPSTLINYLRIVSELVILCEIFFKTMSRPKP